MNKISDIIGVSHRTVKLFVTTAWIAHYQYGVYRLTVNNSEIGSVAQNVTTKKWFWSIGCKTLNIPSANSDKEYIRAADARRGAMRYINTFLGN